MSEFPWQNTLVFAIVGMCVAFLIRNAWQTLSGSGKNCGCTSGGCNKKEPEVISIQLGDNLLRKRSD